MQIMFIDFLPVLNVRNLLWARPVNNKKKRTKENDCNDDDYDFDNNKIVILLIKQFKTL